MKRFLLSPDAADGGTPERVNPNPAQPPATPSQAQPGDGKPTHGISIPPAAGTVLDGERSERELKLEEDLKRANERAEKAEGTVKERETKISELENRIDQAASSQASADPESKPFRLRRIKL